MAPKSPIVSSFLLAFSICFEHNHFCPGSKSAFYPKEQEKGLDAALVDIFTSHTLYYERPKRSTYENQSCLNLVETDKWLNR